MSAVAATETRDRVPLLVGGRWQQSSGDRWAEVFNPSSGKVIAQVPLCSAAEAGRAVEAAALAWPEWSNTPAVDRARVLFRFHALLERSAGDLAALVTREHGKTLAESRGEIQRGLEMVEFACGVPSLLLGDTLANIAAEVDAETARHPLGVCVGITPYNFPAMVPMWMFPVAIVCGNTFVLKPSEKVPLSSVRIAELLVEAGLPSGVFNLVHGDRECVDALISHPQVAAISFVGSTAVARHVYESGTRNGKRVQSAGGAKNHMIIMPDANLEQAGGAVAAAAFGCSGQRCMAGSVAVAVGPIGEAMVDTVCDAAAKLRVGRTDDGREVDVGPLIRREHLERVTRYLEIAAAEGADLVLDGRGQVVGDGFFLGPSIIDHVEPEMRVAKEEIFGPVLSVIRVQDLEQALAIGRACPYGNGASIFTRDGYAARQFKQHFNAGMIGINVGVPAPMAWFPFTGWNQSFFGDLHMQGSEGVQFYTRQKMTLSRWFQSAADWHGDPVWRSDVK